MAAKRLSPAQYPTIELRDMMLRAVRQAYIQRGITNPNVGKDSDIFVRFDAIAEVMSLALANSENAALEIFAESASDEGVLKHAKSLGLGLLSPEKSSGSVIIRCVNTSTSASIAKGDELVSPDGIVFKADEGGTFSDGDYVAVIADVAGSDGNMVSGTKLQWSAPSANLQAFATVDSQGLTGGSAEETIEELRARIIAKRSVALLAGNADHLISIAENVSSAVKKAFVYPALFGPASSCVVLMGDYTEDSNYDRTVPSRVLLAVADAINAVVPADVNITVLSSADENANVAMVLSVPEPVSYGGVGGGWLDDAITRFPKVTGASKYCYVVNVWSASEITVDAEVSNAASVGVSIAAWNPRKHKFTHAKVTEVVSIAGTSYRIKLDTALDDPYAGDWVCPDAENLDEYGSAILESFGMMGPGEATDDAVRLPRARRRPEKEMSYYHMASTRMYQSLLDSYPEIATTSVGYASKTTPTIPTIGDPPNVLSLYHFGFYG